MCVCVLAGGWVSVYIGKDCVCLCGVSTMCVGIGVCVRMFGCVGVVCGGTVTRGNDHIT